MTDGIFKEDLDNILRRVAPLREKLRGKRIFLSGDAAFYDIWLAESFHHINREYALGATLTVLSGDPEALMEQCPHFKDFPEVSFVRGDVRNFTFPDGHFDYVIHVEPEVNEQHAQEHPELLYPLMLERTRSVLDFTVSCKARKMLFIDSGAVYGVQPTELSVITEDFLAHPEFEGPKSSAYGRGALHAERLCLEYAAMYRFYVTTARCFAFIGPHLPTDPQCVPGGFIADCLAGRPLVISGDATALSSYIYGADLAVWLWTILVNGLNDRAYNVGSEQAASVVELAEEVNRCCGGGSDIQVLQPVLPGIPPARYIPCTGRARKELQLTLDFPLREALEKSVKWHLAGKH
jgi:dTDP-glucose 4,6-dehydratase